MRIRVIRKNFPLLLAYYGNFRLVRLKFLHRSQKIVLIYHIILNS